MDSKVLVAFVAGVLLASGLVYLVGRPEPGVKAVNAAQPLVVEPAGPPAAAPAVADAPLPTPVPSYRTAKPSPAPVRQKEQMVAKTLPPAPVNTEPKQQPEIVREPEPAATVAPAPEPPRIPEPPPVHSVTLAAGTNLQVRVGETLTTQKNQPGDSFLATLAQPLVIDGFVIAERGARAEGRVVEVDRGGKVKGVSRMIVELTKLTTADGQHVRIRTASYNKEGQSAAKKDAAKVGVGAALGAAIGAIAGGGKGAGIGAGLGGAAGAGDVLLTRGPDAVIPVETRLSFRVEESVTITEKPR